MGAVGYNSDTGCVYAFTFNGTGWSNATQLTVPSLPASSYLGYSLAMSADGLWIVAGAPNEPAIAGGM